MTNDRPDGLEGAARARAMTAVALSILLSVLDYAVANVALPTIACDLHTTPSASIWVVNAYQLASLIALLPVAALGEILGAALLCRIGLTVFIGASALCALSHSLPELAAARALQGLGGACIMGVNLALVRFIYPASQLGRGVALNGLVIATGVALGPSKDVLKFDLSLRLGLELSWQRGDEFADGLLGDARPVNEIYEYWCFFLLRRLLADICDAELPGNGSFIHEAADGLQVRLEKGKRSRVSFLYNAAGPRKLQICLFYNRRFQRPSRALTSWEGSYTAFFDPDYSVLVTVLEGETKRRHWLHFDAKYRLEMSEVETLFAASEAAQSDGDEAEDGTAYDREIARIHKQDDLYKMHTYRDGILSSRGAYILFPGDRDELRLTGKHQNLFVRHPSAFSGSPTHRFPSVGAFDLCPGRDTAQTETIKAFLKEVFDTILTASPYQEETGLF